MIGDAYFLFRATTFSSDDDTASPPTHSLSLFNIQLNSQSLLTIRTKEDVSTVLDILKSSETLSGCIVNNDFQIHEESISVSLDAGTFYLVLQPQASLDSVAQCDIVVHDQPPPKLSRSQDSADANNLRLKMKLLGKVHSHENYERLF